MKDTIKQAVDPVIEPLGLFVDDAFFETEEAISYLRIVLDSEEVIDLNKIVEATRLMNPVIDSLDIKEEDYMLDIYSKEKGEIE